MPTEFRRNLAVNSWWFTIVVLVMLMVIIIWFFSLKGWFFSGIDFLFCRDWVIFTKASYRLKAYDLWRSEIVVDVEIAGRMPNFDRGYRDPLEDSYALCPHTPKHGLLLTGRHHFPPSRKEWLICALDWRKFASSTSCAVEERHYRGHRGKPQWLTYFKRKRVLPEERCRYFMPTLQPPRHRTPNKK